MRANCPFELGQHGVPAVGVRERENPFGFLGSSGLVRRAQVEPSFTSILLEPHLPVRDLDLLAAAIRLTSFPEFGGPVIGVRLGQAVLFGIGGQTFITCPLSVPFSLF